MSTMDLKGFIIENYRAGKPPEEDVIVANFCNCNIHYFNGEYKAFYKRIEGNEEITTITAFDALEKALNFVRSKAITEYFDYEQEFTRHSGLPF